MKILYIWHYAGRPDLGMEYRGYYLAREWRRQGHEVVILGASFSHLRQIQPAIRGAITRENIDGLTYYWFKTPSYKGNGFSRLWNIFVFVALTAFALPRLRKMGFDAVVASSTYPFDNYLAHRLASKTKAVHIYEVHDLWPLSPMELGGYSRYHPFILFTQAFEDYAYKHCDAVVSILPFAEPHMKERGLADGKYHHVPNGIVAEDWQEAVGLPDAAAAAIGEFRRGRLMVGYAGSHGLANALDTLIEASARTPGICYVLVGQGPEKARLVRKAGSSDNILFLDPIPKRSIPAFLGEMDILYISSNKSRLYESGTSPNKLFDYMMAGKPIINAMDGPDKVVGEAMCGSVIPACDVDALVEELERMSSIEPEDLSAMGLRGREYIFEHHDYRKLAADFLTVIRGCLALDANQ